jgi:hypothetical protein
VDEADDGAEPPGGLEDRLDPLDEIVRRADRGDGAGSEGGLVHGLVGRREGPRAGALEGAGDVLVVVPQQAVAGLGAGLLAGLGDVPAQQHAPVLAVDGLAMLGGRGLREAPLGAQGVQTLLRQGPDRDDADPVLAGERHARGADLGGDGEGHVLLQGQQLQRGVLEREPVGPVRDALAAHEPADDPDGLVLAVAEQHRIDPERVGVRRQRARPGAEDRPPAGHVIELHQPLRHVERMVVGQGDDPRAELDALRPLARGGEEHLGRPDGLPAARMMLAAPELVVPEPVEMLDEIEIAAELQHRVLADRMVRGEKGAEV